MSGSKSSFAAGRPFSLLIKWLALLAIRIYQLTLSGRIGRDCIYAVSCSRFAEQEFKKREGSFIEAYRKVQERLKGCRIASIESSDEGWVAINSLGRPLHLDELDARTVRDLSRQLGLKPRRGPVPTVLS